MLIIWESLTTKIVEPLGGKPGITPNFSRLAHEGILFDGLYASGERTPKGLPAILSGFPSQPMAMVLESADKSAGLPSLNRTFAAAGYRTVFVYGGNPAFVNIRRYLLSTGFVRLCRYGRQLSIRQRLSFYREPAGEGIAPGDHRRALLSTDCGAGVPRSWTLGSTAPDPLRFRAHELCVRGICLQLVSPTLVIRPRWAGAARAASQVNNR